MAYLSELRTCGDELSPKIELITALTCEMTDEEAISLVARLPRPTRRQLRMGPILGDDLPCRICQLMVGFPSTGFTGKLFAWHLGIDIHGADGKVGTGEECYRRCLVIYRASGWNHGS